MAAPRATAIYISQGSCGGALERALRKAVYRMGAALGGLPHTADALSRILSLLNTPPSAGANRDSSGQTSFLRFARSVRLSGEQRFIRRPCGHGHLRGLAPIHFVDVHSALAAFD